MSTSYIIFLKTGTFLIKIFFKCSIKLTQRSYHRQFGRIYSFFEDWYLLETDMLQMPYKAKSKFVSSLFWTNRSTPHAKLNNTPVSVTRTGDAFKICNIRKWVYSTQAIPHWWRLIISTNPTNAVFSTQYNIILLLHFT